MTNRFSRITLCIFLIIHSFFRGAAQDNRVLYPSFFSGKTYVEATAGYVDFAFTDKNLLPGFTTEKIYRPHIGVRLTLLGYNFNNFLSAHISYMRPVLWIYYKNVNGDQVHHTVTMNISSVMLRGRFPVNKSVWVYSETGFCLVTRNGFYVNAPHVLPNANFGTISFGTGVQYRLSPKSSLVAGMTFCSKKENEQQPSSLSITGGFNYSLQPLSPKKIMDVRSSPYRFPKQMVQAGYSTAVVGFGVNNFFANNIIPVFWGGDAEVKEGVSVHYQRNFFHTRKVFSIDWGASASYWKSRWQRQEFYTLSLYPLFRFSFLHKKVADLYFDYSVAGPSFISKFQIDQVETGRKFTFQDFMGIGMYAGKSHNLNAEIRIMHFSNGDLFPKNNGVKVPLSFMLGYAFF